MKRAVFAAWVTACAAGAVQAQVIADPAQLARFQQDKQLLVQNPGLDAIPGSLIVKFNTKAPQAVVAAALTGTQSAVVRTYSLVPGLAHVRTTLPVDQALAALNANPWIEYAEPDYVQRPISTFANDTYIGLQWGLHNTGQSINGVAGIADADIDMPEAWDITQGDAGFVIAVIDTGTQWTHPDLDANMWSNPGETAGNGIDDDGNGYIDDTRGWDFYTDDNDPNDENGHGTHTAGTIGAEGNNAQGVAGVAWRCKIMPLRFLGPQGGSTTDAIAAVNYAAAKGVKVSNNSWGGGGYSSGLYAAINSAKSVGHVFVAAAGNAGTNNDASPFYPASYNLDNIISVAATTNRDGIASFSNYGATTVDLGAPGVDIASTYTGSGYAWLSGTSMASPHVAGVVALVYQQNPGFSYGQVVGRILSTTRPISALSGRTVTGGVLNAFAALQGAAGNTAPVVTITAPGDGAHFFQGTSVTFSGSATDTQDGNLSTSIVWTNSVDQVLHVGASFSTSTLGLGTHVITASVTDAGSLMGTDTVTITIDPIGSAPADPVIISATNNANRTATVRWEDRSTNETSFQLERQKQNRNGSWGSSAFFTAGANTTSYTDNSNTGTFRYRVRARNASGDSNWSGWAQVTVTRR